MAMDFQVSSPAFQAGGRIPTEHTCDGRGISPPLMWRNTPEGTRTLALVVDDPDAATKAFVHWVVFNLPPDQDVIPAGVDVRQHFQGVGSTPVEGVNDFGDTGWGGPCPPGGNPHRYVFRLYALDAPIDLGPGPPSSSLRMQWPATFSPKPI